MAPWEADSAIGPRGVDSHYRYCVYGVGITSDSPLRMPQYAHDTLCEVECRDAPASLFREAVANAVFDASSDGWHRYAALHDGTTYVRWTTVGEFLVAADGRRILCRRAEGSSAESFHVYLLGQALSFALVKQRFEPLHATSVIIGGRAVAFLGRNGSGKSTLAACCLEAGDCLVTDDLLIVQESGDRILAYPGPPRIKLFPRVATRFLGRLADGVPMNADTEKLILPIDEPRSSVRPVPLDAIYLLKVPGRASRTRNVVIESLSPRAAFMALVQGAFNRRLAGAKRVEQQFALTARLADLVPVKSIVYPRSIESLPAVRRAILEDLERHSH
jgi:hypothetical protein